MKKILIFAGYFYPHIGGFEKNIGELSKRLISRGYSIDIVTDNSNKSLFEEQIDGMHIYRLPCWNILGGTYPVPRPSIKGTRILFKLLGNNYDIVHTQTRFFIISLIGLMFAKAKRIPLVHTERGSRHSAVSNKLVDIFSRTYDHTIGSVLVKSAQVNIGVSKAAGEFLSHLGAKNIQVVPNGIDTSKFDKYASNVRGDLGIAENTTIITFVGRLISGKGVQDLISIFPNLKIKYPFITLLIVGDGPYRIKLEKQCGTYKNSKDIMFLGQKNINEVIGILNASDIFINPSYSEGLPTSVMEAASIGLPIIATDVGGTREIVIDNQTGFLIKAADKLQMENYLSTLISDKALCLKLGECSKKYVFQNYDWQKITDQMISIMDTIGKTK